MAEALKAPFPYFGGKSRIASEVWRRLGSVDNYVEPFAGSLAVLLSRPTPPGIETVNDIDCMVANFWRAIAADPEAVAEHADWPINEADLTARHNWLVSQLEFRDRMKREPYYYDARVAGFWVWGASQWIGRGWCEGPIHKKKPSLVSFAGVHRKIPHLSSGGTGIQASSRRLDLFDYFERLASRLRFVRVCCGDWTRVLTHATNNKLGITGMLLDPPYDRSRRYDCYAEESDVSKDVERWAIDAGRLETLRIALCGYEGEYDMPADWTKFSWTATGGYASLRSKDGRGRDNSELERVWFSPACINPQPGLFDEPILEDASDAYVLESQV